MEWSTLGDGKFNNRRLQYPTYTAGPNDKLNGYVELMLTAHGLAINETCHPATIPLK
ncbi:MAG: hypothetical protein IPF54_03415 [Draconibacterium sp.]|nr:hypothetical protein [Draconibacterium sp.]